MNNKKTPRRRKEARPAEIIEAALIAFSEKGFAGTRLEDVAARAGIVKGTVYRYFDSKEALFEAAIRSRMVPLLDDIDSALERNPASTEDILRMMLRMIHARLASDDVKILLRIILSEGRRFPHIPEFYYREMISKGFAILDRIAQRGIERGEFRDAPASRMPRVVMGPAIMALVWAMAFEEQETMPMEEFFDAHIDLVLHGLLKKV